MFYEMLKHGWQSMTGTPGSGMLSSCASGFLAVISDTVFKATEVSSGENVWIWIVNHASGLTVIVSLFGAISFALTGLIKAARDFRALVRDWKKDAEKTQQDRTPPRE